MSQNLVLEGVAQRGVSRKQSVLQRLFAWWFDAFVYNQIWEDPRVDIEALRIGPDSNVLTISSGGCNALNYLLESPGSVTAVDLNRHHINLLKLKIASVRASESHADFFSLFGHGRTTTGDQISRIADTLDPEARSYWSQRRRSKVFSGGGLYDHSRNGYFLKFFQSFARLSGCRPQAILEAATEAEQAELFDRHIAPFFDSPVIKLIGKLPVTMFGLGIPPQQYDELKKDLGDGSVIDIYRERVRKLAVDFPIADNYFAWQALARRYDTEHGQAIPEYLKAENFETLKHRIGRIGAAVGSVTDAIADSDAGSFDRFVFLDAQDWMDAAAITSLWSAIAVKAPAGSRIIFRTAGADSPIETALPKSLRDRFNYEAEASRGLFAKDRAAIYGGFHLYVFKG